jgi:hypothetical protein
VGGGGHTYTHIHMDLHKNLFKSMITFHNLGIRLKGKTKKGHRERDSCEKCGEEPSHTHTHPHTVTHLIQVGVISLLVLVLHFKAAVSDHLPFSL